MSLGFLVIETDVLKASIQTSEQLTPQVLQCVNDILISEVFGIPVQEAVGSVFRIFLQMLYNRSVNYRVLR